MPSATDNFLWSNPWGGYWGTAANWTDATINAAATAAPLMTNAVTIIGGSAGSYLNIAGTGAAASMTVQGAVLLWGTASVAGAITLPAYTAPTYQPVDFELDGAASLSGASLVMGASATLEAGDGSIIKIAGTASELNGFIAATNGSTIQLGGLIANGGVVAVDAASSIEVGNTGAAALGAITIDANRQVAASGSLLGNIIVNGTLGVQGGSALTLGASGLGSGQTITGTGQLLLSEASVLNLALPDSVGVTFTGPSGVLGLSSLTVGTISGFASGDVIQIGSGLATGLMVHETTTSTTLKMLRNGRVAGTITLAGNYVGDLFHLSVNSYGQGFVTLQTLGTPPAQPTVILGTPGSDRLYATANGQIISGLGGGDILSAGTFTAIDFKDTSANLNGGTINAFGTTDMIDLTDMKLATASLTYTPPFTAPTDPYTYTPARLAVTDGTHRATVSLSLGANVPIGYFTTASDGGAGTLVKYVVVNTDSYNFGRVVGGAFGTVGNWQDLTTGTTAAVAPGFGNALTIAGGAPYTDITGNGFAASLTTSGNVALYGTANVGSKVVGVSGGLTQSGNLVLDGKANLTLAGLANVSGLVEIGGASTLVSSAGLSFGTSGAGLSAIGGSAVRFTGGAVAVTSGLYSYQYFASKIAVDSTSSIEFGSTGHPTVGALTIDAGTTAFLDGLINGNVVVNGTLEAALYDTYKLTIAGFGTAASAITGTGALAIASGTTLSLGVADSVGIQFLHTYASASDTLILNGPLPTGAISGFQSGDLIKLGRAVTGGSYSQVGAKGTLTLKNGLSTIGSLVFAGSYNASRFQIALTGTQTSSIVYAAAPSTLLGGSVSSNSGNYSWTNRSGGNWGYTGNWLDVSTGQIPTTVPGAANSVTINDYGSPAAQQIIGGSGAAASLNVYVATNFVGNLAVTGQFYSITNVSLTGGASVSAGSLSQSSNLQVSGASALTFAGTGASNVSGMMSVLGGSSVKFAGGSSGAVSLSGTVIVDATSKMQVGSAGSAVAGALTIDAGQSITLGDTYSPTPAVLATNLVVNGRIAVNVGLIQGFGTSVGTISGTGTISIGGGYAASSLILNAADSATIAFAPNYYGTAETLEIAGPLPTGAISGFAVGDLIKVDRGVTGASYAAGVLTLLGGATTIGTLKLPGTFTGNLFHVDVAPASGVASISLQVAPVATASATLNATNDAYSWTGGASNGNWITAANWTDTTTHTTPATAPGTGTAVTIAGTTAANKFTVIGNTGTAARIAVSGNVMLTGTVAATGSLTETPVSGAASTLALDSHAKLSVGAASLTGSVEVGTGSTLTASGWATLTGASLLALNGSAIQVAALVENGSNNTIAVDGNSTIRIGTASAATAGALTLSANTNAAFSGSIFGNVVVNSTMAVIGGSSLYIDMSGGVSSNPYGSTPTISGTGVLSITEGSTLGLGAADSAAINFAGPRGTLLLATLPTGVISGFAVGDVIQIDQTVTAASYVQTTTAQGTLTLKNGAATVGSLKLGGSFNPAAFHLDAAFDGSNATISLQSLGLATAQPTLIQGSVGADQLSATTSGQTITGQGGGDTINAGGFASVIFKDTAGHLNASTIQNFVASDFFDVTDMPLANTSVTYAGGVLTISNTNAQKAVINLGFQGGTPATGSFHAIDDGALHPKIVWS